MGKVEEQQQQVESTRSRSADSTIICAGCSTALSRIVNVKCVVVLIFSLSIFLPAMFWALPFRWVRPGFDAKDAIKLSATVQAYFILQKPVSVLVPFIGRLEYDIYSEIGVPDTKVAILSMHQIAASNYTNVVFGVLSGPVNVSIDQVSLSLLRSSLIELFLQRSNLTLTTSVFGEASSFGILKFPGGISLIPEQSASFWQIPRILFNFTLHNSILEIKENFVELKEQLTFGLHLRSFENVYVQVTNRNGSTRDPPVTVHASVTSELGSLLPQRLKQLAQIITGSPPAKNLGLDNTLFGKVNQISLSSFLNSTLHEAPPTPSPAPAPEFDDHGEPSGAPYSDHYPSYSPAPSPYFHHCLPPCFNCDASSPSADSFPLTPSPENVPQHYLAPISTAPSMVDAHPCPHRSSIASGPFLTSNPSACTPPAGPIPPFLPDLSPSLVSSSSSPRQDRENGKGQCLHLLPRSRRLLRVLPIGPSN